MEPEGQKMRENRGWCGRGLSVEEGVRREEGGCICA